jgi:hypothetical protein
MKKLGLDLGMSSKTSDSGESNESRVTSISFAQVCARGAGHAYSSASAGFIVILASFLWSLLLHFRLLNATRCTFCCVDLPPAMLSHLSATLPFRHTSHLYARQSSDTGSA